LSTDGKIVLRGQFTGHSPAFSPDNSLFTALGADGKSLILWDIAAGRERAAVKNDAALEHYLVSQNGKMIVTVEQRALRIKSWDAASGKQIAVIDRKPNKRASSAEGGEAEEPTSFLALSPDGKFLVISNSNEVALWKTDSNEEPVLLGKHGINVSALGFSPDGKLIAAGDEGGRMKLWDAISRKELSTFTAFKDAVNTLAFSPDAKTLASGGSGTVKLYGMTSMRELITLTHEPSPTSEIHALQGGEDTVLEILFSPDGKSLITRSGNGIMRIWRGATPANVSVRRQ
jgi:WD40 repeat protein